MAGDELAPDDPLAWAATGFCTSGPLLFTTNGTPVEREKYRYDELDDMLTTTGAAFLGLTIGCARCHDHKFDPISQRDYYRMLAAFTTSTRVEHSIASKQELAEYQARDKDFQLRLSDARSKLSAWLAEQDAPLRAERIHALSRQR